MDIKKLRGEYVLIEPDIKDDVTASGIVLAKTPEQGDFSTGVVKFVGTGHMTEQWGRIGLDLEVGNKVMFRYGQKVKIGDSYLIMVNESDVLVILE